MKVQSLAECDRLIEAYTADLEANIQRKGPMHQTMKAIAFYIVDRGDKVARQCFLFC